jgi:co-chaperonin GroES (HSP10)
MFSKEELLRQKIPTVADIPTQYRPEGSWIMVKNLPAQGVSEGGIILPDRAVITYTEGHIVAFGSQAAGANIHIGDCVTWNSSSAYLMEAEKVEFSLIKVQDILMRIPVRELRPQAERDRDCREIPIKRPSSFNPRASTRRDK